MHRAVGVEAFGVLAHDDEIDRLAAARREAFARARRADIGVEVERACAIRRTDCARLASGGGYSLCETGPSSTPAAAFALSSTAGGNVVPAMRCAAQPMVSLSKASSSAKARAAARNTASVAAMISGPMPSPSNTNRSILPVIDLLAALGGLV